MRRMTRMLVAPSMALALGLSLSATAGAVEEGGRQAVVLRLSLDGEFFVVTAPIGETVRVVDRAGRAHLLVPVRTPGPEGTEPRLALELYEAVRVNGTERPNLLDVVSLPARGDGTVTLLTPQQPIEVESAGLRELSTEQDLRPVQCCIVCEGVEACAFCVEASCGLCCVR